MLRVGEASATQDCRQTFLRALVLVGEFEMFLISLIIFEFIVSSQSTLRTFHRLMTGLQDRMTRVQGRMAQVRR